MVVPDLPGCFSAGDTLDEALAGTEGAATAWIDAALDDDVMVPMPSSLITVRRNPKFAGWTFGVVTLEPPLLDTLRDRR